MNEEQEQRSADFDELRRLVRLWLDHKAEIKAHERAARILEQDICKATHYEGGGLDLHWPLVIDGQTIDWDCPNNCLVARHCTQL